MSGTITGTHTSTVTLTLSPSVVTSSATISISNGIGLTGTSTTAWVLTNYGSIFGGGAASGTGVLFTGGGTITNKSGGTIKADRIGVHITGGAAQIANYGLIEGKQNGVDLTGSTVNTGTVVSTVTNSATIKGAAGTGVMLRSGGTIENNSGGVIYGGTVGIYGYHDAVTVTNAGTIAAGAATDFAVQLHAGYANRLALFAGYSFVGTVSGGNSAFSGTYSTLELGSSASVGTLSGLGVSIVDFTQINVDAGATWKLEAAILQSGYALYDAGTLINEGIFNSFVTVAAGAMLTNYGSLGSGVYLMSGATLTNKAGGTISGGIGVRGGPGTVVNDSAISSSSGDGISLAGGLVIDQAGGRINGFDGVNLAGDGTVNVQSGGVINTAEEGVFIGGATASVVNYGSIGGGAIAVELNDGGLVSNKSGATMTSGAIGVIISNAWGTVVNAGEINSSQQYGVKLGHGGTVSNTINGSITSAGTGVFIGAVTGTVVNDGGIDGPSAGVYLGSGGAVTNQSNGFVTSGSKAIVVAGAAGTIANGGSISGGFYGVYLTKGGTVDNQDNGRINSGSRDVAIKGAAGSVANYGYLGATQEAISLDAGGVVSNHNLALITAGLFGIVVAGAAGTVVNAGAINASTVHGVTLGDGGTVTNASTGVINGGSAGGVGVVIGGAAGTVVNAGSIGGHSGAVSLASGYTNLLTMDPGAVFGGSVDGGNAIGGASLSTMELASVGATTGTFSGIGSQYLNFARIHVDAAAAWHLIGSNSLASGVTLTNDGVLVINNATVNGAGAVVNDALLVIDPSTVDLAGITGTGTVAIGAFSTVDLQGAVALGQTIDLVGTPDLLVLGDPAQFAGTIDGFAPADTLQLTGITDVSSADVIAGNVLRIIESGGGAFELQLGQSYTNTIFKHAVVGGDTDIQVPCFLAGTRIATPAGERAIETLRIGDAVLTRHGSARHIKWIGRRGYSAAEVRSNAPLRPILIAAGALSDNVPRRTLAVSAMHALVIDGLFIPAAALVNGVSIRRSEAAEPLLYLHLEFDTHEVVLAEAAASESFLDEHSRDLFDNAAEYVSAYGNTDPPQRRAPRTEHGYALEVVRRRIAARAGIFPKGGTRGRLLGHVERLADGNAEGWVLDEANPTMPVELEAWHGGAWLGRVLANRYRTDLDQAGLGGGRCAFHLPLPPGAALSRLAMRRATDGAAVPIPG